MPSGDPTDDIPDEKETEETCGQQLIDGQLVDLLTPQIWLQPIKCESLYPIETS